MSDSLKIKPRNKRAHKGDFGNLLVIGGQLGMAGAPALAGMAALRSGAGKVTIAVPHSIVATVARFHPSLMTLPVGDPNETIFRASHADYLINISKNYDVVVFGPGIGRDDDTVALAQNLYSGIDRPMIVDADALYALSKKIALIDAPFYIRILTPHAGEFLRLAPEAELETDTERRKAAIEFCQKDKMQLTYLVLKGHKTVVASDKKSILNPTGNPGMATAGTGDCLAGVLAAAFAVENDIFKAIQRATYVHGLAGDLAAKNIGEIGMVATDLIEALPKAWQKLIATR